MRVSFVRVFVETGRSKVFAGAVDWPGWCRSARDEASALQTLVDYGPRYGQVLQGSGLAFRVPAEPSELVVAERHEGDATTDFGAPSIILDADRAAVDLVELSSWQSVLQACWSAFDSAARRAMGRGLRRGPRGGGREVQQIIDHILQADQAFMERLAWRRRLQGEIDSVEQLHRTRQSILDALNAAAAVDLPETGLRGGRVWPPRFYVRRVAWHVLDHAWEIEDRMV